MLLHQGRTVARISPWIRYVEMRGNGDQCVVRGSIGAAVLRLHTSRVHALDGKLEELELIIVTVTAHSDDSVQWYLHVRQLLRFLIEEETDDTTEHSLVGDHQDIVGSLQLGYHWLDAMHRVHVALSPWITITQLVLIAPCKFLEQRSLV